MTPMRVGVLVPASNPTVEPELHRSLPQDVGIQVAHLHAVGNLRERLDGYLEDKAALTRLSGLPLECVLFACTGSSYPLGLEADRRWSNGAVRQMGTPTLTAAGALLAAFAELGATRLHLVSPYPTWLTEECVRFWHSAGHPVDRVWHVESAGGIYDTDPADLRAVIDSAVAETTSQLVLVAGTGAPSLAALDELSESAETTSVPVLSSNLAGAWAITRLVGSSPADSPSPALRRLAAMVAGPV